jgi:hypothetical protein
MPPPLIVRRAAVGEEQKPLPPLDLDARTVPLELEAELADSFMRYSMSIIMGRALPDLRDGLKPVHRRYRLMPTLHARSVAELLCAA